MHIRTNFLKIFHQGYIGKRYCSDKGKVNFDCNKRYHFSISMAISSYNSYSRFQLASPLDFSSGKVSPITLPAMGQETAAGTNVTVTGWGNLEVSFIIIIFPCISIGFLMNYSPFEWCAVKFNNPNRPDVLNKVEIPTVSDLECRRSYGPIDMFDSFICAGVPEGLCWFNI